MKKVIGLVLLVLCIAKPTQATYTQQFVLATDSTFLGQIMVAELQTSIAVLAEATTTAGHIARGVFARQVIQDPAKYQSIIAYVIASQNNNAMTPLTVPSTVADSLIQTAMNAQWTNMAGYFGQ